MAPVHHRWDPEWTLLAIGLRNVHPPDRHRLPRRTRIVHSPRHVRPRLGRQGSFPVDPGRSASSIALRHLPNTDQRVRPRAQHQFLQRPDRGPVLLPRRLEDPAPQPHYVLLMGAPIDDLPVQDSNVSGSVHLNGVQLAPSVREVLGLGVQRLTCPRQLPCRPGHGGSVSGQLCHSDRRSADPVAVGFLPPFGHRHWLLGHPVPPEDSAPLTIGLPGKSPDPDGVSTFRTLDTRPDWVPSLPRDHAVLIWPVVPA